MDLGFNPFAKAKEAFNSASDAVSSAIDAGKAVADLVGALSNPADLVEAGLDLFGLPEWMGDLASTAAHGYTGDYMDMVDDILDLVGDLAPPTVDSAGLEEVPPPPDLNSSRLDTVTHTDGGRSSDENSSSGRLGGNDSRPSVGPLENAGPRDPDDVSGDKKPSVDGGPKASEMKGRDAAKAFLDSHSDSEDLMNAIRNGEIPDEVIGSTAGMMMLQQKMQDISRMNELMTNMARAMHEMEMAITRNIRA